MKFSICFSVILGVAGLQGCSAQVNSDEVDRTEVAQNPLYQLYALWPNHQVPVCFDTVPTFHTVPPSTGDFLQPGTARFNTASASLQSHLQYAYALPIDIIFSGWQTCPWTTATQRTTWNAAQQSNGASFVVIQMLTNDDENADPGWARGIRNIRLKYEGEGNGWRQKVLHEFAHVLGYAHEYLRSDYDFTADPCTNGDGTVSGGNTLGTPLDVGSVTASGYCKMPTGDLDYWDVYGMRKQYGTTNRYSLTFNTQSSESYTEHGSDWNSGFYKATCAATDPLVGLSANPTNHAAITGLCKFPVHDTLLAVTGRNIKDFHASSAWRGGTDWAYGFNKGECDLNYAAVGVSQSTALKVNALRCNKLSAIYTEGSCYVRTFDNQNSVWSGDDWSYGNYKGECNAGDYIVGVSANATTGAPHSIKCCAVN